MAQQIEPLRTNFKYRRHFFFQRISAHFAIRMGNLPAYLYFWAYPPPNSPAISCCSDWNQGYRQRLGAVFRCSCFNDVLQLCVTVCGHQSDGNVMDYMPLSAIFHQWLKTAPGYSQCQYWHMQVQAASLNKPTVFSRGHQQNHITMYMVTLLLIMLPMHTVMVLLNSVGNKITSTRGHEIIITVKSPI